MPRRPCRSKAYDEIEDAAERKSRSRILAGASSFVVAFFVVLSYAWLKPDAGASTLRATRSHKAAAVAAGTPLSFRVRNAYVDAYGEPGTLYSWASSYDAIAEPHKWQELVAVWAAAGNATNVTWAFDDGSTASGAAVLKKFFALRTYAISLTAADENGTSVAYAGTVIVKYIRREIRQLTDGDRHAWLDAMQTLWNTSTEAGSRLYGPAYLDINDLSKYHVTLSSDVTCDHMHDGLGF
ncbi:hypothetical protein JL720_675 [Aureococcus anophagefferens]|nr:hypothetical protein JL720_675 [Aureococcus anophagefferens]